MEHDVYIPGPCINFKLAVLARLMDERYKKAYRGLGLTTEQVRMLLNLKMAGKINQQELARRLELEKSSFSRTLKKMTEKKLIRSETHEDDGRKQMLSLTPAGEKKAAAVFPAWKQQHEKMTLLLGESTVNEINRMIRILKTNP
jgi:DNA-binding MarR family transcriptional regulator